MLLFRLVMLNKRIYPVNPTVLFLRCLIRLQQQWLQRTFHRTLNCGLRKECLLCALLFFLLSILFRFLPSTLPLFPLESFILGKRNRCQIIPVYFDALIILHTLLFTQEAISTIFSSFSKTALRALKGSLFSVSIFLSIYIQRSKSVSHSSSSLLKEGSSIKINRSLSENTSCVSRSERTMSVRSL